MDTIKISVPDMYGWSMAALKRWRDEKNLLLGWTGDPSEPWSSDREVTFTHYHGGLYKQVENEKFFYLVGTSRQLPHIICSCGSIQFTLQYGSWELLAQCAYCQTEEGVYSG